MTSGDSFPALWSELSRIGRDQATGGYHRFAWTAVDLELRAWFADQARQRDLRVETDRNGNIWAWWGTPAPGAVVTGSHLDSVPGGGAFDGPLGVASAFCAIDALRASDFTPTRPIAIVDFADEEGARFGVACVGSRLMTGVLAPDAARELRDSEGVRLADAMASAGVDPLLLGRDELALRRIGCFVELHVEQGRALADLNAPIGVASAIWPHGRWRLRFTGEPNHAGTTRLVDRRDPMLPLAGAVQEARMAAEHHHAVATVGKVSVDPGAVNGIAAQADAWLDARAADDATLFALVERVTSAAEAAAHQHGVTLAVTRESVTPVVDFDPKLRQRLCHLLGDAPQLPTAAGHDAGILSAAVPSAMLFVRNPTGASHSPAENADQADCLVGVLALASVLADLSARD
jgi:N-carbamoyl-L-amino-acid hydrolase